MLLLAIVCRHSISLRSDRVRCCISQLAATSCLGVLCGNRALLCCQAEILVRSRSSTRTALSRNAPVTASNFTWSSTAQARDAEDAFQHDYPATSIEYNSKRTAAVAGEAEERAVRRRPQGQAPSSSLFVLLGRTSVSSEVEGMDNPQHLLDDRC